MLFWCDMIQKYSLTDSFLMLKIRGTNCSRMHLYGYQCVIKKKKLRGTRLLWVNDMDKNEKK